MRYIASTILWSLAFVHPLLASPAAYLEQRAATDQIAHGNYFKHGDQIWRYYETASGQYVGFTPEEWPIDGTPKPTTSIAKKEALDEEGLIQRDLKSTCGSALTCAINTGGDFLGGVCYVTRYVVDGVKAAFPSAKSIGEFLDRPFVANFVGVGGQNALVTWVFHETTDSGAGVAPETCSSQQTELDLVQTLVQLLCKASPDSTNDATQSLRLPDGSVFTVSLSLAEGSTVGGTTVCGAPKVQP